MGGQEESKQTFTKILRLAEQTVKNENKWTKHFWLLCIFDTLLHLKNLFACPVQLWVFCWILVKQLPCTSEVRAGSNHKFPENKAGNVLLVCHQYLNTGKRWNTKWCVVALVYIFQTFRSFLQSLLSYTKGTKMNLNRTI